MKAAYAIARMTDLAPGDWLEVQCTCGHVGDLQPYDLKGVTSLTRLIDLERRYLCRMCAQKGDVTVMVLNNQ